MLALSCPCSTLFMCLYGAIKMAGTLLATPAAVGYGPHGCGLYNGGFDQTFFSAVTLLRV